MEDFVSYKIARKLKGKGFRDKTFAYYPSSGILQWRRAYIYDTPITDVMKCSNKENTTIDAPTISQVLKWLREEKKIFIDVATFADHRAGGYFWGCEVYDISQMPKYVYYKSYILNKSNYNEAAIAGIEYCLDNLI